jgi:hypothetical protein
LDEKQSDSSAFRYGNTRAPGHVDPYLDVVFRSCFGRTSVVFRSLMIVLIRAFRTKRLYATARPDLLLLHSRSTAVASTTGCIDTLPASHHERAHASPDQHKGQPNEPHRLSNPMRLQGEYTPSTSQPIFSSSHCHSVHPVLRDTSLPP